MHKLAWDDLRFFLAVAERGSLAGAARGLGVNHTTVLRRVNGFERELGVRLFDRLPTGYAMTAAGEELLLAARQIESTVDRLERKLAGQDLRLEGELRVATTDTLALAVVMPHLAAFRAAHPGVVLELAVANTLVNLTRRDADVALRPTPDPPETLVGRRVAVLGFAVYARRDLAGAANAESDWVGPDASLAQSAMGRWLRRERPAARFVCRADSVMAIRQAVACGLGVGLLPCYVGDTAPELARVGPVVPGLDLSLWLLTHEDLRRTARVRAFMQFMAGALERDRALLEGRRPLV